MQKFLVISYDDDQQQPYFDHLLADDRDQAIILIEGARSYAIAMDALTITEIREMANLLDDATP